MAGIQAVEKDYPETTDNGLAAGRNVSSRTTNLTVTPEQQLNPMTPLNERPTPEKESENNYFNDTPRVNALIIELRKPCDRDRMDMISLARTLERSLTERTEERERLERICRNFEKCVAEGLTKDEAESLRTERDTALAKRATVTAERDALKHALIELEAAAEAYAADQSRATDSRCGLVQPITVEDGDRLLSALKAANEITK